MANFYAKMAREAAKLSECKRRQVGAVIVTETGHVITGYNHMPEGIPYGLVCPNCPREGKPNGEWSLTDECPAIHAEQDAIFKAARLGVRLASAVIYVSEKPCNICERYIREAGMTLGGGWDEM